MNAGPELVTVWPPQAKGAVYLMQPSRCRYDVPIS